MKRQRWLALGLVAAVSAAGSAQAQVLFEENFDGLALGDSVNERAGFPIVTRVTSDVDSVPVSNVFSATGPAGWAVDNTLATFGGQPTVGNAGVPGQGVFDYGVDEWEGWSFASKDFWVEAAGDQDRSQFALGTGTVAIADPDEYFDLSPLDGVSSGGTSNPVNGGYYNTSLSTPSFGFGDLGVDSIGLNIQFDSSYRLEASDDDHGPAGLVSANNQAGELVVVFDTGEVQTASIFDSVVDTDDATNAAISETFFPATAATSAQAFFNMGNAGNDWWWAIDNIETRSVNFLGQPDAVTFSEDFEGVALGDSVNERRSLVPDRITAANNDPDTTPVANAFTNTPPAGWNVDNSNTPAQTLGNDNVGSFELEGWNFLDKDFWEFVDQQDRQLFDNASGTVAVADGDEWDDLGDPTDFGELNTLLETPEIDITSVNPAEERLLVEFDASWRDEDDQAAIVTAEFSDGTVVDVIRWESDPNSSFFFDDAPNTAVAVLLDIPSGATEVQLTFQYIGTNDWWFAIDNVSVTAVPEPASLLLMASAAFGLAASRRR